MSSEKELPLPVGSKKRAIRRAHHFGALSLLLILLVFGSFSYHHSLCESTGEYFKSFMSSPHEPDSLCPIVPKIDPTKYISHPETLQYILKNKKFHKKVRKNLSGAVKIPTEIYDGMENPSSVKSLEELYKLDPRWKSFKKFQNYLYDTYPLIHKHLHLKKVNKFGLVYTWKGTDETKKPIMLTAHQDVVPVPLDTLDQWTYPPYDGKYDGEYMYGRGVSDCKNLLIALMGTVELLLKEGDFNPERTIILAFGYDEEAAGKGAQEISQYLVDKYGADSFLQIIDEGDEGFEEIEGVKFILPATGEKGHLNSVIDLYTPGGHLSVPPKHTSIGILAQLITKIEDHEFLSILSNVNPVLGQLYCLAEHSPILDKSLKSNILKAQLDENANGKVIEYMTANKETEFLIKSSQAVDIIQGGVKSNALPEHVSMLVNTRISVDESVSLVVDKFKQDILEIADKFNLGFILNGKEIKSINATSGYFNYSLVEQLEPAPVSPINGESWNVFGGCLRYLYEELIFPEGNDTFIVAPFLSTGNTDTKSYWDLTRNIYRYQPNIALLDSNIHSIDEKLLFDGHLQIISFYYFYLQVIDNYEDF